MPRISLAEDQILFDSSRASQARMWSTPNAVERDKQEIPSTAPNDSADHGIQAALSLDAPAHAFLCANPEQPGAVACGPTVTVPARSAIVLMEQ